MSIGVKDPTSKIPLHQCPTARPSKKPAYAPTAVSSTDMLISQLVLNVGMSKLRNPARTVVVQEDYCLINACWYEPEVQKAIRTATEDLRAKRFTEATRTLAPVIDGRPLTEPQRQAVGVALQQINQAINTDPTLDSKEMYELRAKMFHAVHSGPRF